MKLDKGIIIIEEDDCSEYYGIFIDYNHDSISIDIKKLIKNIVLLYPRILENEE